MVPVIADIDTYRCAHLLIERYGDDAPIEAANLLVASGGTRMAPAIQLPLGGRAPKG